MKADEKERNPQSLQDYCVESMHRRWSDVTLALQQLNINGNSSRRPMVLCVTLEHDPCAMGYMMGLQMARDGK